MSDAKTAMEMKEEDIRKHYAMRRITALAEIDHAPRYAEEKAPKAEAAPSSHDLCTPAFSQHDSRAFRPPSANAGRPSMRA